MGQFVIDFVLKGRRDQQGRVIYNSDEIASGISMFIIGACFLVVPAFFWWNLGFELDGLRGVIPTVFVLAGGLVIFMGVCRILRRRSLIVDCREKTVLLRESTLRSSEESAWPFDDVQLCVHESLIRNPRGFYNWRRFTLCFNMAGARFSVARVKSREKIEEVAQAVQAETGIPWKDSPEFIDYGYRPMLGNIKD